MADYFTSNYHVPNESVKGTQLNPTQVLVLCSGFSSEFASGELPGAGYKGTEYYLQIQETVIVDDKPQSKNRQLLFTNDDQIKGLKTRLKELGSSTDKDSLKGKKIIGLKQFDTYVGVRL